MHLKSGSPWHTLLSISSLWNAWGIMGTHPLFGFLGIYMTQLTADGIETGAGEWTCLTWHCKQLVEAGHSGSSDPPLRRHGLSTPTWAGQTQSSSAWPPRCSPPSLPRPFQAAVHALPAATWVLQQHTEAVQAAGETLQHSFLTIIKQQQVSRGPAS